jgi:hypothetical protein
MENEPLSPKLLLLDHLLNNYEEIKLDLKLSGVRFLMQNQNH